MICELQRSLYQSCMWKQPETCSLMYGLRPCSLTAGFLCVYDPGDVPPHLLQHPDCGAGLLANQLLRRALWIHGSGSNDCCFLVDIYVVTPCMFTCVALMQGFWALYQPKASHAKIAELQRQLAESQPASARAPSPVSHGLHGDLVGSDM